MKVKLGVMKLLQSPPSSRGVDRLWFAKRRLQQTFRRDTDLDEVMETDLDEASSLQDAA